VGIDGTSSGHGVMVVLHEHGTEYYGPLNGGTPLRMANDKP
jgi:hypothetical protein